MARMRRYYVYKINNGGMADLINYLTRSLPVN